MTEQAAMPSFSIELLIQGAWACVMLLHHAAVSCLVAVIPDAERCDAVGMIASELCDNDVKYAMFDRPNTSELKDNRERSLVETRDGSLWIGTLSALLRWKEGRFAPYARGGLSDRRVEALFEDDEASLWIGTRGPASSVAQRTGPSPASPRGSSLTAGATGSRTIPSIAFSKIARAASGSAPTVAA